MPIPKALNADDEEVSAIAVPTKSTLEPANHMPRLMLCSIRELEMAASLGSLVRVLTPTKTPIPAMPLSTG